MSVEELQAQELVTAYGSPLYVYSAHVILSQATKAKTAPCAFGLTVRYAVKALSTKAILQVMEQAGLEFDCSSEYEVYRVVNAGIPGSKVSLVSQQFPVRPLEVAGLGAQILPTSLHQLRLYGSISSLPRSIGIRINSGLGSGSSLKTNVGGPSSSFGIWHEDIPSVLQLCTEFNLTVTKLHTHIGSGTDPTVWMRAAELSLALLEHFPEVRTLSLGGGFKVARIDGEVDCDMHAVGEFISEKFRRFYEQTGRKLHLEIEPGTFLVGNAGWLLTTVIDIVSTPSFTFLKVDSGMTEILRPTLYGAQHSITIVPKRNEEKKYVVVGHCCETGDLLTPASDDSFSLSPRLLTQAEIGDVCIIGGAGAYCSSMSTKNYNSYPEAAEVLLTPSPHLIRTRQTLSQITQNEFPLSHIIC